MYYTSKYHEIYKLNKPSNTGTYQMTSTDEAEARRMGYAFHKISQNQEAKDRAEWLNEQARGYCPHCHLLLPMNGECDCGYKKPSSTPKNLSNDFQARLNKLKAGFAK